MDNIIYFLSWSPIYYQRVIGAIASILGIVAFVSYLVGVYLKFGFQKSISFYWYRFDADWRWIFQAFMYFSSLCILLLGHNTMYLLSAVSFSIMAMFPSVLYKHFIIPHCIFATLGILLSTLAVPMTLNFGAGLILCIADILFIAGVFILRQRNQFVRATTLYWIEVFTISMMLLGTVICRFLL